MLLAPLGYNAELRQAWPSCTSVQESHDWEMKSTTQSKLEIKAKLYWASQPAHFDWLCVSLTPRSDTDHDIDAFTRYARLKRSLHLLAPSPAITFCLTVSSKFLLQRFSEYFITFVSGLRVNIQAVLISNSWWYCLESTHFMGYYTEMHYLIHSKMTSYTAVV